MPRRKLFVVTPLLAMAVASFSLAGTASAPSASASPVTRLSADPMLLLARQTPSVVSTNWSGYAASGSTYTAVQGKWVEPTATCAPASTTDAFFWVGLDGYSDSTVEQDGTAANCVAGVPQYYAWYEFYPAYSVPLPAATYPVAPGDLILSQVISSGTKFTINISDYGPSNSLKWTYTGASTDTSAEKASAEWIAEAPGICSDNTCTEAQLTDFGSVTFTVSGALSGGKKLPIGSLPGNTSITMENDQGTVLARPAALTGSGESFTDTWYSSATS